MEGAYTDLLVYFVARVGWWHGIPTDAFAGKNPILGWPGLVKEQTESWRNQFQGECGG